MDHGTSLLKGATKLIYRKFDLEEKQFKTCTCPTIWCKNWNIVRHPSKGQKARLLYTVQFQSSKTLWFLSHSSSTPMGVHFRLSTCQPTPSNNARWCLPVVIAEIIPRHLPIGVSIFSNMKGVDGETQDFALELYKHSCSNIISSQIVSFI